MVFYQIYMLLYVVIPFLIFQRGVIFWFNIIIKSILLIVLSISFSGYIGVSLTLFITFILELFSDFSVVISVIVSYSLMLAIIKSQENNMTAFFVNLPQTPVADILTFIFYSSIIIVICAIIKYKREDHVTVKELNRVVNEATSELAQSNIQLQDHLVQIEFETITNERKEISREIHDTLAHSFTNIIMMIEASKDIAGNENSRLIDFLTKIQDQAKKGLNEISRTIKSLRKTVQKKETGLKAIKKLIDSFAYATKIEINLSFGNVPLNFNEKLEKTAYRIVQEGLTNAIRHGKASKVDINFSEMNQWLNIYIKDNGIGSKNLDLGYGLLGMKERVEELGGKFECESKEGEGYLLNVWIPLFDQE